MQRVSTEPNSTAQAATSDEVAVEEPLEIRVAGDSFATTMRTPGEDHALAAGLLFSEGIIASRADVGRIFHCGRAGSDDFANTIDVAAGPGVALDPERALFARRGTLMNAACGVCGRQSIEDLLARCTAVPAAPVFDRALLRDGVALLHTRQPHFARTGGLHAALILDRAGRVLRASEDVGRHNATDKVIGALVLEGRVPASEHAAIDAAPALLAVSGRVSFEIVQKAVVARLPIVAGVSAPTSLAIDLAERCGITLAGFVRGDSFNLYTHPERVTELALTACK